MNTLINPATSPTLKQTYSVSNTITWLDTTTNVSCDQTTGYSLAQWLPVYNQGHNVKDDVKDWTTSRRMYFGKYFQPVSEKYLENLHYP